MRSRVEIHQVDVFTRTPFAGNPAAVVPEADELDALRMQAIAREMNLSETAFVLGPDGDDHDVRIRFFTPTTEVPSCGHATLAAHFVLVGTGRRPTGLTRQRVGAGILPVRTERVGGSLQMTMIQSPPSWDPPLTGRPLRDLIDALGLLAGERVDELPVHRIDTGNPKFLVPVRSRAALDALEPDHDRLRRFSRTHSSGGFYLFTFPEEAPDDEGAPTLLSHARMFAPQIGISEDPVTGNGAGPLGVYSALHGLAPADGRRLHLRVRQGETMGRPGTAEVEVEIDESTGRPSLVRVSGRAVTTLRGELLP